MARSGFAFCAGFCRLWPRLLLAVGLVIAAAQAMTVPLMAQSSASTDEVRAVFLVSFIRFTDWPAKSLPENAPYVVGVAGSRGMEEELLALAEKKMVRERRIRVVRVKSPRDLVGCHLLYISSVVAPGEEIGPGVQELMHHVRGLPVLTVSTTPSFLQEGGIINLYTAESGTLRFEISLENARKSGLALSSKLLALARIVDTAEPPVTARRD